MSALDAAAPEPSTATCFASLRANTLAKGHSGCSLALVEKIVEAINAGLVPWIPEQGSVGACGDLAPLAHMALMLIGEGQCYFEGALLDSAKALKKAGVKPHSLGPKEGLSLINGTQIMTAIGALVISEALELAKIADIAGAMSLEAFKGTDKAFAKEIHAVRPHAEQMAVATNLRKLLTKSGIAESHKDCGKVQDPYSFRCMPQVHGASRNAWQHLRQLTEIELNAVTDNPIILGENDTISGGNFHGQPLALPLDYACFAAAEIGNISDRRCYLLLEGKWGLPLLLMSNVGLNSGFMIPQYTTAALVTENKTLCFPASADSIPTSLGQEDHVSMGSISGRKLSCVLDNLEYILAIELMSACQAIEFRRPLKSSGILEAAHEYVRNFVGFAREDRIFSEDILKLRSIIRDHSFVKKVNEAAVEKGVMLNSGFDGFNIA